jgi:pyruvate dehydrogenase E2 component (dihydrolipoamide acetyltransferase)
MSDVVTLPALGVGMTEGTFLNWIKQLGDSVNAGDVIAEIESDKATLEVEANASGVILELLVQPGQSVPVGSPIARIGAAGGSVAPAAMKTSDAAAPVPAAPPAATPTTPTMPPTTAPTNGTPPAASTSLGDDLPGGVKASPVARAIAEQRGIDLRQIQGTGPGGRIVKADVESYQPSAAPAAPATPPAPVPAAPPPSAAPAPTAPAASVIAPRPVPTGDGITAEPTPRIRERIAVRMIESKTTIPHFYLTTEIDMAAALDLRKQINATLPEDSKVTVNDIVVKAVALTLRQFPNLNSHFYGDKIVRYRHINIGVAVALDGGGLINVVAKDADSVSISALAKHNKEMIAAVRAGKGIKPDYIEGSTFTVSNLGAFEIEHFMAIINPPEAGILAVGSAKEVPIVVNGEIKIANRMKVTLSVDHRVSDGAEGAQFLQTFKKLLEAPMRLLL